MKWMALIFLLVVFLLGIAAYLFSIQKEVEPAAFWKNHIEHLGAADAYGRFLEENNNLDVGEQHLGAHIFGESLYDALGAEGIGVCGSDFGFGCFHGFFLAGVAIEGPVFVRTANDACVERFGVLGTGCLHGIGHGIVEYIGKKNLKDALALCEQTTQVKPLLGCTSGLFMEAHIPLTVLPGEDPPKPHPFSNSAPYGLCEEVIDRHKMSCFFELGGWWQTVLHEDFERMGELCALADPGLRGICAQGVGRIISDTREFEVTPSAATCDRFSQNENLRTQCYIGAAWSMFSGLGDAQRANELCGILPAEEKEICMQSFDISKR